MSGLTRRSIARMLGLAPVAAPIAAKAAAEKVLSSAGVRALGAGMIDQCAPAPVGAMGGGPNEYAQREIAKVAKRKLMAATVGIPEAIMRRARESAKRVDSLDIDLAAMVSMSPAAKIALQRERNYQRYIDYLTEPGPYLLVEAMQDEVWR